MNWGGSCRGTCKELSFGLKGASFEVESNPIFLGLNGRNGELIDNVEGVHAQ